MEVLETAKYQRIRGRGYYRYVDDIPTVIPANANVDNKLRMLNEVDITIQYTTDRQEDVKIPFLYTYIHPGVVGLDFLYTGSSATVIISFISCSGTATEQRVLAVIGLFPKEGSSSM